MPRARRFLVLLVGPVAPPQGGMATSLAALGSVLPGASGEHSVQVCVLRTNTALGLIEHIPVVRSVLGFCLFLLQFLLLAPRCRVIHLLGASNLYFWLRCAPVLLLGRFLGRRVVLQYKGGLLGDFLASSGRATRWFLRRAHVLAVPSPFLARVLAQHGVGSVIIPNIAEVQHFPWRARALFAPRLLVARSLEPLYGVDIVLAAFARLRAAHPEAQLHIAGDGVARAALEAQAASCGGVTFHGALKRAALAALHEQCDIFVNASRADNMPVSMIEAMASGLAIVSTSAGGIPDLVVAGRDALLVPVDDTAALHLALESVLADVAAARQRAESAHAQVASFEAPRVRAHLLTSYGC